MKYIVVNDFIERGSLKQIKAGEEYACLDPKRAEKLIRLGYIAEKAQEEPKKEEKPKKEKVEEPEKKTAKAKTTTKRSVKTKKA